MAAARCSSRKRHRKSLGYARWLSLYVLVLLNCKNVVCYKQSDTNDTHGYDISVPEIAIETHQLSNSRNHGGLFTSSRLTDEAVKRIYWNFYGMSAPLSQLNRETISSQYSSAVQRYAELIHKPIKEASGMNGIPKPAKLMDNLWNIIHTGSVTTVPVPAPSLQLSSLLRAVEGSLLEGVVVEIGSVSIGPYLASKDPNITVATVLLNASQYDSVLSEVRSLSATNLFLAQLDTENLAPAADQLYGDHQVLLSNLILSDLPSMVGTLLPHEFEELMAQLLAVASNTIITIANISASQEFHFFIRNWPSPKHLLVQACAVADLTCDITTSSSDNWKGSGSGLYTVRVTQGRRALPAEVCSQVKHNTECHLYFLESPVSAEIVFSDGSRLSAPVVPDALSIHTLQVIGCSPHCQELLFYKSLQLPHMQAASSRSLLVLASRMLHYIAEPEEFPPDASQYVGRLQLPMESGRVTDYQRKAFEKTRKPDEIVHLKHEDQDINRIQSSPATSTVFVPLRGSVADSQLDGVAVQWQRVDGAGPSLREEAQHINHMSQHWDREDVQFESPLKKDRNTLDQLGKTWEREQSERKGPMGDTLVDPNPPEPGIHGDGDHDKTDTVLRRDEKQLKRAMGFLHGNSKMRDTEDILGLFQAEPSNVEQNNVNAIERKDFIKSLSNKLQKKVKEHEKWNVVDENNSVSSTTAKASMIINRIVNGDAPLNTATSKNLQGTLKSVVQKPTLPRDNIAGVAVPAADGKMEEEFSYDLDPEEEPAPSVPLNHLPVRDVIFAEERQDGNNFGGEAEVNDGTADEDDYDYDEDDEVDAAELDGQGRLDIPQMAVPDSKQAIQVDPRLMKAEGVAPQEGDLLWQKGEVVDPLHAPGRRLLMVESAMFPRQQRSDLNLATQEPSMEETGRGTLSSNTSESNHQAVMRGPIFGALYSTERAYDLQWKQLRSEFSAKDADFSMLLYGGKSHGLLGVKLARKFPLANILTVLPTHQQRALDSLRHLSRSMDLRNIMFTIQDLSVPVVNQLYSSPEIHKYQFLSAAVFTPMLELGSGFPAYLGRLLTLAHTTYLEVPDPQQLLLIQQILTHNSSNGKEFIMEGLVPLALNIVEAKGQVTILKDAEGHWPLKLLKIQLASVKRQVQIDCEENTRQLDLTSSGIVNLVALDGSLDAMTTAGRTFSLHTLINLGIRKQPKERRRLFLSYLEVGLREDMCPLHLHWYNNSLAYHPSTSTLPFKGHDSVAVKEEKAKDLGSLLKEQLEDAPFSFLDYNSWQSIVTTSLATKHLNSTFLVLIDNNPEAAQRLLDEVTGRGLYHIAIANLSVDDSVTSKLMESPDFLRYQILDWNMLLSLIDKLESANQLYFMLGHIIATGITTFIQLPNDKSLSLAMTTLFPDAYHGLPSHGIEKVQVHHLSSHPLPLYQDAETRLIGQVARAHTNVSVRAEVLHPIESEDEDHPWAVLRLDVNWLNTTVHHHFDYKLDGHTRKYTLHASSANNSDYEVHLIRQTDGFRIPYGDVHAISLIALLRLGLLGTMREKLYEQFLQLPYYEDMAPWNIVFQAGRLSYIDYDTKDVHFTKMVPAAFQIMNMLLNYERTVKDFGHCGSVGRVMYNLDSVAKCVGGSNPDLCTDSRYPVACGDSTCRSTYIECLQALQQMEANRAHKQKQAMANLQSGFDSQLADENRRFQEGSWNFGIGGPIETTEPTIIIQR